MAEEQAVGSPSNRDPCTKCHLDSQPSPPPLNPAVVKQTLSVAAAPCSSSSSSSLSAIPPSANRCVACRKRVGLTGFRCRCGSTCCGTHRYPENHGCEHDYKAAGREQIRRQNPVVVAEKLQKI